MASTNAAAAAYGLSSFQTAEFNSHVADYTKGKHLSGTHRYHNIITVGDVWQAGLYLPDDVTGEVKYKKCGTQPTPQHAAAAADHVAKLAGIQGRTPNFSCQKVADAVVAEVTKIGLDNGSLKSCGCGVIIISNRKTCIACIPPLEYLMVVKCNKVNPAYGDSYDARFQYFHDGKRCEIRIGGSRLQAEAAWQRDVFLRDELGMPADAVGVFNFKDQAAYMQARAQELQAFVNKFGVEFKEIKKRKTRGERDEHIEHAKAWVADTYGGAAAGSAK